jgi:aminoglycoside/choline kinase family phosphotransferase
MSNAKVSGAEALARAATALAELGLPFRNIAPLAGDGSNRAYVRVQLQDGRSAVAMVMATEEPHRAAEEVGAAVPDGRIPFLDVGAALAAAGLPVPAMYGHAQQAGVILLEDLGDTALADAWRNDRAPIDLYRQALRQLVTFQTMPRGDSLLFARRYDEGLWHWEWQHFVEYGVEARYDVRLAAADAAAVDELARALAAKIAAMPVVPVHRDYHSRNLLVQAGDRLRWIDFQDALLGPALYDPASLLYDAYVDLTAGERQTLLHEWADEARRAGVVLPADLDAAHELVAAHRMAKAAGRFEFFLRVKGLEGYTRHIPRLLARLAGIATAPHCDPQLREFIGRLAAYVPEWSALKNRW